MTQTKMRKSDVTGKPCPATLGEYKAFCEEVSSLFGIKSSKAVKFLEDQIASSTDGLHTVVLKQDSQMRKKLYPLIFQELDGNGPKRNEIK